MNLRILFLLSLLALNGCFPVVKESPAPQVSHSKLSELFPYKDENIMVIPVWQDAPTIMSEESISESSTLWLSAPIFTIADSLIHVHDQIPSKTSALLIVGPGGAIGRGVSFDGYIIVSETGNFLLLDKSGKNRKRSYHGSFTNQDKNDLIAFIKTGKTTTMSDPGDKTSWNSHLRRNNFQSRFSDADRDRIVSFLEEIPPEEIRKAVQADIKALLYNANYEASDVSVFISDGAKNAYKKYLKAKYHKAFAQSDDGAWGYDTNETSIGSAIHWSLLKCETGRKSTAREIKPCQIINVNDYWASELR